MIDDESDFDALRRVSDPFAPPRWSDVLARVPAAKAPRRTPRPLRVLAVAAPITAGVAVFAAVAVIVGSRHPTADALPPAVTTRAAIGDPAAPRVPQLLDGRISATPRPIALSALDAGSRLLLRRLGSSPTIVGVGAPDASGVTHALVTGPRGECVVQIAKKAVQISACAAANGYRAWRILAVESGSSGTLTRKSSTATSPPAQSAPSGGSVFSFSGIAVDGIVAVRLTLTTGSIDVPVHDNVFWLDTKLIAAGAQTRGFVGLTRAGAKVAAVDPTPSADTLFLRYAVEMKLPARAVPGRGPNLPLPGTALVGVVALRGAADGSRMALAVYRGAGGGICIYRYRTAARSLGPLHGTSGGGHVCDNKPTDSVRIDNEAILNTHTGLGDIVYSVTAPTAADAMVITDAKGHRTRYRLSGTPNPVIPSLQALLFERLLGGPAITKITIMEGNKILPTTRE